MAAPRPLPPPPVESIAVEGRKRNRRCTENKKAGEVTTSTSVSSCKDGLLPLPQVSALTVYAVYRHITVHLCEFLNILLAKTVCVGEIATFINISRITCIIITIPSKNNFITDFCYFIFKVKWIFFEPLVNVIGRLDRKCFFFFRIVLCLPERGGD